MSTVVRFATIGLVIGFSTLLSAPASANPASHQCLRSEAIRILERGDRNDPDVQVSCHGKKPIYRVFSWTYKTYQGNTVVQEQRINNTGSNPGTYFNDDVVRMCGNPCN